MVVSSLLFLLQSLGELAMLYFASIGVTGFSRFNKWLSKPNCTKTRIYHQPISVWNMCFCIVVKYACTYIHVCIYGSIHTYIWYDLCISFFPPTLFERLFFWCDIMENLPGAVGIDMAWYRSSEWLGGCCRITHPGFQWITHPGFGYFRGLRVCFSVHIFLTGLSFTQKR